MKQYEALTQKLAEARDELFNYDRMFESGMINGAEHVIDEMVTEIKQLRKALEFYSSTKTYIRQQKQDTRAHFFPVFEDSGKIAREALK